jgi:hypothetical protein
MESLAQDIGGTASRVSISSRSVEKGQTLVEWDPYTFSILTESGGSVRFKDIIDKVTVHEEVDEITGMSRLIIVDSPDEKKRRRLKSSRLRARCSTVTTCRRTPTPWLATTTRCTRATKDITGGLPRVVELFEARKPRETAVISESDGVVRQGGIVKGMRKILVVPDDGGEAREYSLPRGVHVNVQEGDRVSDGPTGDVGAARDVFEHRLMTTGLCMHAHVGFLAAESVGIAYADGCTRTFTAPQVVDIEPGHDGWVVGDDPAVLIEFDFLGETAARFGLPDAHRH